MPSEILEKFEVIYEPIYYHGYTIIIKPKGLWGVNVYKEKKHMNEFFLIHSIYEAMSYIRNLEGKSDSRNKEQQEKCEV